MGSENRRIGLAAWMLAAIASALVAAADHLGYRFNETPSVPVGVWRVRPVNGPLERGQIVSVCPPPTGVFLEAKARGYLSEGSCPGGLEPMLKPIAALEGDVVEQTSEGLRLNGRLLPHSLASSADSEGRPLPKLCARSLVISKGEVFLVSRHERSFDSRYFGPLPLSAVKGVATRFWAAAPEL
ncbi:conjugative transfer signal peptidase TraF [Rhodomicrobium vannielii ATCC 17100]|uniref:Conjugative transfer signal peptidase TraF n=2 Tax=Rhodomicrobium vannielii TaxID=1069 RepID=E3I8N9_RHOVT|nr:conjugative transfer signal peptidase TraF [Rhodomicrobium vannielii ATCC 17100]